MTRRIHTKSQYHEVMELCDNGLATSDDYFWKTLVLPCPPTDGAVHARVRVTQPHGLTQEIEANDVHLEQDRASVRFLYPLIDEGRYEPSHGTWDGAWEMGVYRFEVVLYADGREIARDQMTIDPHSFFPSDRMVISVDARPQIIECAPRQMLYTDEAEATFLIRIRSHRVPACHVEVDVTARESSDRVAGPWRWRLNDTKLEQGFAIGPLPDGEYWIRIRVLDDGEPIGPVCVRKFWKQASQEAGPPDVIELAGHPEVLVDRWSFEQVEGITFLPDDLQRDEAPLVTPTGAHEEEMLAMQSLAWDESKQCYECIYANFGGRAERQATADSRAHLKMLLVSEDGQSWSKPRLGRVEYDGSTDNNILRDDQNHPDDAEKDKVHDIEHARFRFYDPQVDGPVNIDNVFLASGKGYFPFECRSLKRSPQAGEPGAGDGLGVVPAEDDGPGDPEVFSPRVGEHWPFEKRGDLYLVLSREPVLYLGVGMDLYHTTESIRCHVEQTGCKRLLYYFRPGAPAYPPHGAVYDNMHLSLRCLAVIWTDDGLHYHRRFVLGPDHHDRIGSQFYAMGLLQRGNTPGDPPGRPVLDKCLSKINQVFPPRNLYLGTTLLHWGIEQTQAPELVWTRDLLHFHRFGPERRSLIENGPGGTYSFGMIRDKYKVLEFDDTWWYPFTGVNTRHNGYGVMARVEDPQDYRRKYPNHADAPYFDTWEGCIADGKQTKYLPAFARGRSHRVAHAEPTDLRGTLTSRLLRVDGDTIGINAATSPGGFIEIEVEDGHGKPLLAQPCRFEGDEVAATIADVSSRRGQTIRLRFTLVRARLYAFQIV